jgi:hypothetical protein
MSEYYFALTDINNAIDRLIHACPTTFYNGLQAARNIFSKDLVADVAPVRHGRWKFKQDKEWVGNGKYWCSVCRYGFASGAYHKVDEFKFCPMCGAKMDGGE